MTLLAGAFLALAPALFTYRANGVALHDVVLGTTIVALTVMRLTVPRWAAPLSWAAVVAGLWALVASFFVGEAMTVRLTEAGVGALVIVTSALSASAIEAGRRRAPHAAGPAPRN
jgi:hypothetical protein